MTRAADLLTDINQAFSLKLDLYQVFIKIYISD